MPRELLILLLGQIVLELVLSRVYFLSGFSFREEQFFGLTNKDESFFTRQYIVVDAAISSRIGEEGFLLPSRAGSPQGRVS